MTKYRSLSVEEVRVLADWQKLPPEQRKTKNDVWHFAETQVHNYSLYGSGYENKPRGLAHLIMVYQRRIREPI
jgi:hypothetical protein